MRLCSEEKGYRIKWYSKDTAGRNGKSKWYNEGTAEIQVGNIVNRSGTTEVGKRQGQAVQRRYSWERVAVGNAKEDGWEKGGKGGQMQVYSGVAVVTRRWLDRGLFSLGEEVKLDIT